MTSDATQPSSERTDAGKNLPEDNDVENQNKERYGLDHINKITYCTDPDLTFFGLGTDPLSLGIFDNRSNPKEEAFNTFYSPWGREERIPCPESIIPNFYYSKDRTLHRSHLQKFTEETLFYIFYNMPREHVQAQTALELANRGWQYHQKYKKWFFSGHRD